MHLFLGVPLDSYGPDDYLCGIIHPGFGLNSKTMWVIKHNTPLWAEYLERMEKEDDGLHVYFNPFDNHAFRFPDENTAFAVLAFLNRDNLEVTCLE